MKQGTANLAEDYCYIHKALRPVGKAQRQIAPVPPSNSRPGNITSSVTSSNVKHVRHLKTTARRTMTSQMT